jgi:hypothetical protein
VIVGRRANCLRATAVRKRDSRTALKGIDTALMAWEMFAKLGGQLQGPQHNHLHLHAEVPSREEAIEAAVECLQVFAPHLLAAGPVVPIDTSSSSEGELAGASNGNQGLFAMPKTGIPILWVASKISRSQSNTRTGS